MVALCYFIIARFNRLRTAEVGSVRLFCISCISMSTKPKAVLLRSYVSHLNNSLFVSSSHYSADPRGIASLTIINITCAAACF
jgi:hypothetical protein